MTKLQLNPCFLILCSLIAFQSLTSRSVCEDFIRPDQNSKSRNSEIDNFCRYAATGDLDNMKKALTANPKLLNGLNKSGFTALHQAACYGRENAVKFLIENKCDLNAQQRQYKGAPLQYAAARGHVGCVKLLIEAGCAQDSKDTIGRTPLIWVAMRLRNIDPEKLREVATLLVKTGGAKVDATCKKGRSALHYAAQSKDNKLARLLVKLGANPMQADSAGKLPSDIFPEIDYFGKGK